MLLAVIFALPAGAADSAKTLFKKGQDAEARQNYETAYTFYKQAYDLKPKELRYRSSFLRMRFLAAASHIHHGQEMRDKGQFEEALTEFETALSIDPSSFIAQQEIRRTRTLIEAAKNAPPAQTKAPSQTQRMIQQAGGPVELEAISNTPITLKLTEDSKVIYETVGKLAGINVLFDPDYTSRRIRIELNGVTLNEALEIIALESKTFWRPVTGNTIFVAADTPAKRKELEQSVIKTFYLGNLSQPTELQDVVNTMRTILEVNRIQQLPSQGAIVVRGTPDQIALAEKLIGDIDKAKSEVVIDVAIMQVSREKIRNLGINPPTSTSIALQQNLTNNSTSSTNTTNSTTNTTTTTGANQINLNQLGSLRASDFVVTIPPATANFMFSDSDTKLLQNPQVRALDGQKASLKIGERVPVATGSFQPGVGGLGGINPLVNTQFQYIDVGVNIDITPRVHAGREVTLKLLLDISSVDSHTNIGGIDQPVIGQKKVEHEIRLKDGEVNLLGGLLEDSDIKTLSGIPGLSNIPFFKYLFSSTNTDRRQNEIVFVLIPHIVRGPDITDLNARALDVGTANAIELRRLGAKATAPQGQPIQPQPAPGGGPVPQTSLPQQMPQSAPQQPAMPVQIPAQQPSVQPQPAVPTGTAAFSLDPPQISQAAGSTFTVNVNLTGAQNVYSVPLQLSYDPRVLQLLNVSNGGMLSRDGQAVTLVHREDPTAGTVEVTATRPPGTGGVSGQGVVLTLTFLAKTAGQGMLIITRPGARDSAMQPIAVSGAQAVVSVH